MMSLPWHIPLEAVSKLKDNLGQSFDQSLLKHYCSIDAHLRPCEEIQTGIMCEISFKNREIATIQRMLAAGMTVARLKLSELEPNEPKQLVQSIRQAVVNYSLDLSYVYPLAIMVDVHRPDIITGELKLGTKSKVELVEYSTIRLTNNIAWRQCGTADCLYVAWDRISDLLPDDIVFLDSLTPVKIKLVVNEVGSDSVECRVEVGGFIGGNMPIRIARLPREPKSENRDSKIIDSRLDAGMQPDFEHEEEQIAFAIDSDVDGVIVTNTQTVNDIIQIKRILLDKGKHILIFASIETVLAFDNIDSIISEANGIYLERDLLTSTLPIEKIFLAEKKIFAKCKVLGKPCICKAVLNEQTPILSVTDIANLIIDGADVLYLELLYDVNKILPNYDTVKMAEQCIAAAAVICRQAEAILWRPLNYGNMDYMLRYLNEPSEAIAVSAVELAGRSGATLIICLTNSGRTAQLIAVARPPCPILAVTRICSTARQLRFWRGIRSLHYYNQLKPSFTAETEAKIYAAVSYSKLKRFLNAGDAYVLVVGSRRNVGFCDSVRLLYASAQEDNVF